MDYADNLKALLSGDEKRQHLLSLVRSLGLPDCWIGAGTIRNAVWDFLHQRPPLPPSGDIDVIWFDPARNSKHLDQQIEARLQRLDDSVKWSVKNQSRMHLANGDPPYQSASDAMRFWPETATAIGVRHEDHGNLEISAPYGLDDLYQAIVRATPRFHAEKRSVFEARVQHKKWLEQWPLLRLAGAPD